MPYYTSPIFSKILYYFVLIYSSILITICPSIYAGICKECKENTETRDHSPLCILAIRSSKICCANSPFNNDFTEEIKNLTIWDNSCKDILLSSEHEYTKKYLEKIMLKLTKHPLTKSNKCKKPTNATDKKHDKIELCFDNIQHITCEPCQISYMSNLAYQILKHAGESDININKKIGNDSLLQNLSSSYTLFHYLNIKGNTVESLTKIYANWLALILVDYYCHYYANDIQDVSDIKKILNSILSREQKKSDDTSCNENKKIEERCFIRCILQTLITLGNSRYDSSTALSTSLTHIIECYIHQKGYEGSNANSITIRNDSNLENITTSINDFFKDMIPLSSETNTPLKNKSSMRKSVINNKYLFVLSEKNNTCICIIVRKNNNNIKIIIPSTMLSYTCKHDNLEPSILCILNKIAVKPRSLCTRFIAGAMIASIASGIAFLTLNNLNHEWWPSPAPKPEPEHESELEPDSGWLQGWF